ncbi:MULTISPECIES: hypothetical protein [Thermus]|jgi:subtilisin|nr:MULTISPECIES: hypothetical protein [Thermus]QZY59509.1 hypothetical protein K7H19_08815 [Thermus thermophilus]BDA38360.1 hypothetical protein JCM10941_17250 [Thermus thermophilus]BDE46085.1 hypothetical protein TthHB8_17280 [Thermus thermophilus]
MGFTIGVDAPNAQENPALLQNAESTAGWNNTSGHPHPEPFLNVRGL